MAAEVKALLLTVAAIGLLVSAACGGSDDTATLKAQVAALQTQVAQPTAAPTATPVVADVVVGVAWTCNAWGGGGGPFKETGNVCRASYLDNYIALQKQNPGYSVQDVSADVTVRTGSGAAYHVSVTDPTHWINIGDQWPPK